MVIRARRSRAFWPKSGDGMRQGPSVQQLSGHRVHLQHGPIDLVLRAWGGADAVDAAYRAAIRRFETILDELVSELPILRCPMADQLSVTGAVAVRMVSACRPYDIFVTPMAAVAGAVADEVLAAMLAVAPLDKAFVNDGGDIAVHLIQGQSLEIGVAGAFGRSPVRAFNGQISIKAEHGIGGIATSGAPGRSFSLGIADSVTVLAQSAAAADVAATLIANAVDLPGHPAVHRSPAITLDPDSDLGERLVTVNVDRLTATEILSALDAGLATARHYQRAGLIQDAALMLRGHSVTLGSHLFGLPTSSPSTASNASLASRIDSRAKANNPLKKSPSFCGAP